MKTTKIDCARCGKPKTIPTKEYDRQTRNGRDKFYCDHTCAGRVSRKLPDSEAECVVCGKLFTTSGNARSHKCCSKSCARESRLMNLSAPRFTRKPRIYGRGSIELI